MADAVFPLAIDDTSPLVLYSPFRDTFTGTPAITAGWNSFDTASGFANSPSGPGAPIGPTVVNGTSLHLTAADGAALQIDWHGKFTSFRSHKTDEPRGHRATVRRSPSVTGTGITVFGTLVPPTGDVDVSYTVTLDGTPTTNYISNLSSIPTVYTAANDVLVAFNSLPDGQHSLQLTLQNSDINGIPGNSTVGPLLAFDRALVNASTGDTSLLTMPLTSPSIGTFSTRTAPVPDDQIAYRGQWDFTPDLLPGITASFHTSTNIGDRATLIFNGSAVGLTGLTTPASGAYNVTLDSEDTITLSARASFTASSPTLLYFRTGLDPSTMHVIEVVNAGPSDAGDGAGSLLVLAAVNVTTAESSGAAGRSSGLSKGGIAALAIGLTLAVAAVIVAVLFFMRRRGRRARRKREMLVNPRINRLSRLSFLFSPKRFSHAGETAEQKALEHGADAQGHGHGVLDISSPNPNAREKREDSEDEDDAEGEDGGDNDSESGPPRFSAAEKGKARAVRRSNASKNSDGSYSIELPDLTIAQVPRGYLPASTVPSTPSPPRTIPGSLASPTSPRSQRPRGPREMQGRDATRGILLTNVEPPSPVADEEGLLVAAPSYLPEAHISPLRVEFATELPERPDRRTERHVSTATSVSLPHSLKQALAQQRSSDVPIVPSPVRPDPVYSFLDFNSSTSTSLSRSQRQSASSRSKRNTGSEHSAHSPSVNWADLPPDRHGGTASRPSLSPNVSLQPVPLPPPVPTLPTGTADQHSSSSSGAEAEGPDQPFPYDAGGEPLPSPTDSIPFTVSDIHFRHSTHSSISGMPESRRVSAQRLSGSHRLPHPPLPGIPSNPSQDSAAGGSQTVPPFIVQRILGRTPGSNPASPFGSPTAPQFASMTGTMGRPSAPSSPVPAPSTPPPQPASGRGSAGGQAPGAGSGSVTTVFGFQLGRHR
ncbi:hypothetical protein FKP32DRAFT_1609454 [Trametes sanguinea]|nr:hypothetical protein FKP32DRAFT_1609454 [Trametes sanguinea]